MLLISLSEFFEVFSTGIYITKISYIPLLLILIRHQFLQFKFVVIKLISHDIEPHTWCSSEPPVEWEYGISFVISFGSSLKAILGTLIPTLVTWGKCIFLLLLLLNFVPIMVEKKPLVIASFPQLRA